MPIDNGIGQTGHPLDEAVIAASQKRMVGKAEPLLAALYEAKGAAERNIAKRQAFIASAADMANRVRAAYDSGDEAALAKVAEELETYKKSLLRAKRR